jgi:hypothetical protein
LEAMATSSTMAALVYVEGDVYGHSHGNPEKI